MGTKCFYQNVIVTRFLDFFATLTRFSYVFFWNLA